MKRIIIFFWIITLPIYAQQIPLTILHWNDFHSQNLPFTVKAKSETTGNDTSYQVGGSATLKTYLEQNKASSSLSLVLNGGDDFQGSPVSTFSKGMSQIALMNLQAPDAATIGNHEFDYGRKNLEQKFSQARYPIVSANLIDARSHHSFVPPYIIKKVGELKIAIIGLMTTDLPTLTMTENIQGLKVVSPDSTVNALIPELKRQGVNLIVAVTHIGVKEDSVLAARCPDLDIIIGGHSHTPLFVPMVVNGITICQAGTRGRYLGRVDLLVDKSKDTILSATAKLIECRTADVIPDAKVTAEVDTYEAMVGTIMKEQIGVLTTDWKRAHNKESNIGDWICDQFRTYAKSDIAIQNMGGVRKDLLAGPITIRDMWEILPFGNLLMKFSLTGKEILSLLEHQDKLRDDFCQYSGITFKYSFANNELKIFDVTINGKELDEEKMYSLVTNNYVTQQAKKYFGFEIPAKKITTYTMSDRDVCIKAVREQKEITSTIEGRMIEVKE